MIYWELDQPGLSCLCCPLPDECVHMPGARPGSVCPLDGSTVPVQDQYGRLPKLEALASLISSGPVPITRAAEAIGSTPGTLSHWERDGLIRTEWANGKRKYRMVVEVL